MHHFDKKKKKNSVYELNSYMRTCAMCWSSVNPLLSLCLTFSFSFLFQKTIEAINWFLFFCHLSLLQAWLTVRCWSRWSEGTVCPAPRGAPSPCTRWWNSAGRRTRTKDPRSSTCSPSWRTISQPQSHSTNLEKTYSLARIPQALSQLEAAPTN